MKFTPVNHQFSLFDAPTMRPKFKVPISAERIRQAKAEIASGRGEDAARTLRDINDRLDDFGRKTFGKRWDK